MEHLVTMSGHNKNPFLHDYFCSQSPGGFTSFWPRFGYSDKIFKTGWIWKLGHFILTFGEAVPRFLLNRIVIRQTLRKNAKISYNIFTTSGNSDVDCFKPKILSLLQALTNFIIKIKLYHANFSENLVRITEYCSKWCQTSGR